MSNNKNKMSLLLTLIVSLLSILSFQLAEVNGESCHLREFDICMASAITFVQQPANAKVNDAEVEKQCSLFKDTEDCLESYNERCMTPMQNSLVDFMSGGMLKYMKDYCRKGSDIRRIYLKHGDCVNKQRKTTNKCLVEFQSAVEVATNDETNWKNRPKILCCALDRLRDCSDKIIEAACGKEATEVGNMLIKGTFSRAATLTCDKYKYKSSTCKSLLPPPETVPKGSKSKSVLSKMISAITQN